MKGDGMDDGGSYNKKKWNLRAECEPSSKARAKMLLAIVGAHSMNELLNIIFQQPAKGARALQRLNEMLEKEKSNSTNTSGDA